MKISHRTLRKIYPLVICTSKPTPHTAPSTLAEPDHPCRVAPATQGMPCTDPPPTSASDQPGSKDTTAAEHLTPPNCPSSSFVNNIVQTTDLGTPPTLSMAEISATQVPRETQLGPTASNQPCETPSFVNTPLQTTEDLCALSPVEIPAGHTPRESPSGAESP